MNEEVNTGLSAENINKMYDIVIDALFGFSFKGKAREPFGSLIETMRTVKIPVVRYTLRPNFSVGAPTALFLYPIFKTFSIDVPSGWDVDEGDVRTDV